MKVLSTALIILSVAATSAAANNSTAWSGSTGNLHQDGCVFDKHQNGSMSLTGTTWSTTSPASIRVRSHNINNITVEASDTLDNTDYAVTVDYDATVTSNKSGIVVNENGDTVQIGNVNKNGRTKTTISLSGTATMSQDDVDNLSNNTTYSITHTVTCLQ